MEGIDARRLERAVLRLSRSDEAVKWLQSVGLDVSFGRLRGIGLELENEDGLHLVHVAGRRDGRRQLARLQVRPDGSMHPPIPGAPVPLWSCAHEAGAHALVFLDLRTSWLIERSAGETGLGDFVIIAPSHAGCPIEWRMADFWKPFDQVTVIADDLGGPALSAIAGAAGNAVSIVLPKTGRSWKSLVAAGLSPEELRTLVEDAVPLTSHLGCVDEAFRFDSSPADLNRLDAQGRLMRVLQVEERTSGVNSGDSERVRVRSLVVRSDGMLLGLNYLSSPPGTPLGERVLALSDGTRVARLPSPASTCPWSMEAVKAFVAGRCDQTGSNDESAALVQALKVELTATVGLDEPSAAAAAGFIMLSYVYQKFDQLRTAVFTGGSAIERMRLIGSLSRLSHGGLVRSRSRANVLAFAADEVGGAMILDDPGSLAGPDGPTEIGRFLIASSVAGTNWDYVGGSGRRALNVFGPRAVLAARPPVSGLSDVGVHCRLGFTCGSRRPHDGAICRDLVDRLYSWSMRACHDAGRWLDAPEEGPSVAVNPFIVRTGNTSSATDESTSLSGGVDGPMVMQAALAACTTGGEQVVSITQLTLEAALRGARGPDFSPERIGRWLSGSGKMDSDVPVARRRLYGHISRLYTLRQTAALPAQDYATEIDAFAFCKATLCAECPYQFVCVDVFPGLSSRKTASA